MNFTSLTALGLAVAFLGVGAAFANNAPMPVNADSSAAMKSEASPDEPMAKPMTDHAAASTAV